ncbi:hypothetical protein FZI95_13050 [Mycobacterium sp. CBMA247]|nr:hypothetical protein [Mycolicibacterium sp. CBMA 329]MUL89242.1 hypothetical protein [Mycolicibacterium sp. CBMA 331]MUL97809.1 hypothetical protein [Mycolicibacterium sp. CBMA 334]MUM25280.1 hypothetical protein [Mycolicibacterium sp. CBMA 295]MUM38758.1 hypothetical protein [Mycolicibacterium sp. CBMA 247]MUM45306.1 hypothetical protein [Mycolicibacterium sp. CBMA 294]
MRFVVLAGIVAVAVIVWRSRHGEEVWHDADTPQSQPNTGP